MDVKKINFKQPKYLLPAILYLPILFVGYFVIDMFNTDVSSNKKDPRLKTTDYLSGELPEANTDSLLGDKMRNTEKEFGNITDLSGVNSVENDNDSINKKEEYESKYSDREAESVERQEAAEKDRLESLREQNKLRELQNKVRQRRTTSSDFVSPVTDSDIEKVQRLRRQRDWETMNKDLSNSSAFSAGQEPSNTYGTSANDSSVSSGTNGSWQGTSGSGSTSSSGSYTDSREGSNNGYGSASDRETEEKPKKVYKMERETSQFFNTITADKKKSKMITAIIDENIKAVDGSRVRLRLLEDIIVDNKFIKKGTYIYAIMSGFGSQRVQGKVESLFFDEEIIKVDLKCMTRTVSKDSMYRRAVSVRHRRKYFPQLPRAAATSSTTIPPVQASSHGPTSPFSRHSRESCKPSERQQRRILSV